MDVTSNHVEKKTWKLQYSITHIIIVIMQTRNIQRNHILQAYLVITKFA